MKAHFLWVIVLLVFFENARAQSGKSDFFKINGQISFSYENYSYSTINYDNFRARYPDDLIKFNANTTLYFGKYFKIPVGVNYSNQQFAYFVPEIPQNGLYDYIRTPRNNFHINPTYKWARLDLGTYTSKYSDLTTGNVRVFGVGFEINPGKFILSAHYGTSQIAVDAVPEYHLPGAYERNFMSARIGYGKIKGGKFTLNMVKIKDDVNSVNVKPVGVKPMEGISFAPLLEIHLFKNLTLKTETGASITTKDLLAKDDLLSYDNKIMTVNNTTIMDFAHVSSLNWKNKKLRLGLEFRYVGPGYLFAGYRNTETDIIDYKLLTGFNLFKNKLIINAVTGIRKNNIRNTKLTKNDRFIGNINLFAQLTNRLSVNAGYSNFGFNNNTNDPMFRVEMVNNSFSLSPVYKIKTKSKMHQFSAVASFNRFKQYDFYQQAFVNTESNSYNASYIINFFKKNLMLGTNFMYLENQSPYIHLKMTNYSLFSGYSFLKKTMQANVYATLTNYQRDLFTADNKINLKMKLNYKLTKKLNTSVSYSLNNNRFGSYKPGAVSNENRVSFMITQNF